MSGVPEPSAAELGGATPGRVARRLLLATRPKFFTASILPVVVGTGHGAAVAGRLDADTFALALAATVCVHAGANVLNDVYDELGGSDPGNAARIHPYTGGSRFIQNEVMTLAEMRRWGTGLLGAGALFGLWLMLLAGPGVLLLGLAGVALALLYSVPPVQLAARGLGEAAVGAAFGVLPVAGAAWLQCGRLGPVEILVSLPVSAWVAAILTVNEVPDVAADARAGKRTLPVRFGAGGARRIWIGLQAGAVVAVVAAALLGVLAWPAAIGVALLFAFTVGAGRGIVPVAEGRDRLRRAIETTLAVHALGCLWLAGWLWSGLW